MRAFHLSIAALVMWAVYLAAGPIASPPVTVIQQRVPDGGIQPQAVVDQCGTVSCTFTATRRTVTPFTSAPKTEA